MSDIKRYAEGIHEIGNKCGDKELENRCMGLSKALNRASQQKSIHLAVPMSALIMVQSDAQLVKDYEEAKDICTSDFGVACLMMVDVGDNDAGSAHTVESVPEMDDDDSSLSSQDDSHLNR